MRCGCSETMPPRRTGSNSSSRARGHSRPAATSRRATTPCSRATELAPADAVELRIRLTTACAATEHLLGRHDAADQRLTAALGDLDDPASPQAVALMLEIAVGRAYTMRYSRIAALAERALETARPLGDSPLIATAAAALASGLALCGRVAEAEKYRAEAVALVDGLSDRDLAARLDSAVHLAGAELYLDRFAAASDHAERVITVARATGQPAFIPFAFMILAWVHMLRGELADSAHSPRRGHRGIPAAPQRAEPGRIPPQPLTHRPVRRRPGARHRLGPGSGRADPRHGGRLHPRRRPRGPVRGTPRGPRPGPRRRRRPHGSTIRRSRAAFMPGGSFRAKWLELLTRCSLALGRQTDAERAAACARDTVASMGRLRMGTAMAERAAAIVALEAGDAQLAARKALASATAADEVGIPVEAALSRTLAGRALARAGEPERAVAELETAAAALHACGAWRYRDAAELELRRLGRHIHHRTGPGETGGHGLASLTQRERQVADLVVARYTNPEIAAALFLSPKTVETHLRHIFHKLDVTSRVELARTVESTPQGED